MSKPKQARTTPKIPGCPIYRLDNVTPQPGNSVYKHSQQYHVFVGLTKVMTTPDISLAMAEAARERTA